MCYVFGMEFSCTCALLFDQGHHAFLSPVYATRYGYLVGANDMGLVSVRHIHRCWHPCQCQPDELLVCEVGIGTLSWHVPTPCRRCLVSGFELPDALPTQDNHMCLRGNVIFSLRANAPYASNRNAYGAICP